MVGDDEPGFGFDVLVGCVLGVGIFAWQAAQGEWVLGTVMLVLAVVVVPPITYYKARLRRWLLPRAEAAGRRWGEQHPTASRRLRWAVFPVVAAILLWAALAVVWGLVDAVR